MVAGPREGIRYANGKRTEALRHSTIYESTKYITFDTIFGQDTNTIEWYMGMGNV